MTPSPTPHIRATGLLNDGWLVFGGLLAESFGAGPAPTQAPHPKEARLLRQGGRLHRLLHWWTRPLPDASLTGGTDAATRLEILTRGGFPRQG